MTDECNNPVSFPPVSPDPHIRALGALHRRDRGQCGASTGGGYDVVAYFTQAKSVEGKRDFSHKWNNAEWRFASAANPDKYAPQYGGWCAWAVPQGYTASIDPQAWRIVDGKLYLNYSKSVQSQWVQDVPGNISKGNRNWPGIKQKLAAN